VSFQVGPTSLGLLAPTLIVADPGSAPIRVVSWEIFWFAAIYSATDSSVASTVAIEVAGGVGYSRT
jgi:hypothetical protein